MFKSVKARFIFIVIISLVSMLVLILSLTFYLSELSVLTGIDKRVEKMHTQILKLRKDEKNFFIRRDMQYQDKFDKDYQTFIANTKEIGEEVRALGFKGEKVTSILNSAHKYREAFKNISAAYIKRGLSETQGLQGKLREDAQNLEEILKNDPKSHLLLLKMRISEKDFFERKEQKYADEQLKYFSALKDLLTTEKEKALLQEYQKYFQESYDLRIKIGIDNSQGYVYEMLLAAQNIETEIEAGEKLIIPLVSNEREKLKVTTYIIFFLTAFVLFLLIASSARKLSISFDKFIKFFEEAKKTYSHLDEKKEDFTEFIKLSVHANEMIDARVKAEHALQDLNLHLEERVEDGLREIKGLNQEIVDTQKEVVFTMGAIGESRSKETGNHVKRVAQYSYILAKNYGLSEHECDVLREASPMHDIGKIGIPDAVLNKPGSFNDQERAIIETHAELGYEMLKHSQRELLLAAATVSYQHHEKYDGTGYPRGLKGEDIHIYGRITAVADVFDALGSDRIYKKAWPDEEIFTMLKDESGKHFDPKLIGCFFENLDEILEVRDNYRDIYEEI